MQNAGSGCLSRWELLLIISLLFLHKERALAMIHQGTLRYFPKKILSALRACGFFPGNSLLHHRQISRDRLEKKEKKLGGLRSVDGAGSGCPRRECCCTPLPGGVPRAG